MMQISQKKKKYPKNFHKSKLDGLKKLPLPTRAPLFYDYLHFKGCSYLNSKISFNLSVHVAMFLVFHNSFMMLFHILSPVLEHDLMLDNFLITSSLIGTSGCTVICVVSKHFMFLPAELFANYKQSFLTKFPIAPLPLEVSHSCLQSRVRAKLVLPNGNWLRTVRGFHLSYEKRNGKNLSHLQYERFLF